MNQSGTKCIILQLVLDNFRCTRPNLQDLCFFGVLQPVKHSEVSFQNTIECIGPSGYILHLVSGVHCRTPSSAHFHPPMPTSKAQGSSCLSATVSCPLHGVHNIPTRSRVTRFVRHWLPPAFPPEVHSAAALAACPLLSGARPAVRPCRALAAAAG